MQKLTSRARSSAAGSLGFTLIELLVVICIIAIIITFTIPAISSASRGSQLAQGAQMLSDQINLARQTALAKNHAVEIRFYQYGDPLNPGELATDASSGKFRAMQTFEVLDSGTVALGKIQHLPPSIIIDAGTTLSTIINPPTAWKPGPVKTLAAAQTVEIPRVKRVYNSVAFRFSPGGGANLSLLSTNPWFITLHNLSDGDSLTAAPPNFFTIQIDPNNGHIHTYRP